MMKTVDLATLPPGAPFLIPGLGRYGTVVHVGVGSVTVKYHDAAGPKKRRVTFNKGLPSERTAELDERTSGTIYIAGSTQVVPINPNEETLEDLL